MNKKMQPPNSYWAIVTGASSGIGAALLQRLALNDSSLHCLGVGRNLDRLKEVQQTIESNPNLVHVNVDVVAADISTEEGVAAVINSLPPNASVKYIIHNAAIIGKKQEMKQNKNFSDSLHLHHIEYLLGSNIRCPFLTLFRTDKFFSGS